ncbi:mitochondrial carrier [Serendipita vermifera]|nr:mitochondrial carrier [Serendipita vermifera]
MGEDQQTKKQRTLIDPFLLFAGGCSALASRTIVHPLDTIRVRIQTYPPGKSLPKSIGGLVGTPALPKLYAGLPVALGFSVPALAVYLTTYDAAKLNMARLLGCKDQDPKTIPWWKQGPIYLISGLTAEMVSGVIWTPMDVAKSRLQRGKDNHTKARTLLKEIWKMEGYRGVWRGYWVSIAVFGPQVSLYWAIYEGFKTAVIPNYNPYRETKAELQGTKREEIQLAATYAVTSGLAMSLSAMITNPIEIVRTRWQTSGADADRSSTMIGMVRRMWKEAGWRAFMRGALIRGIYYIPSNAISMTTFEMLRRNREKFGF